MPDENYYAALPGRPYLDFTEIEAERREQDGVPTAPSKPPVTPREAALLRATAKMLVKSTLHLEQLEGEVRELKARMNDRPRRKNGLRHPAPRGLLRRRAEFHHASRLQ